MVVWNEWRDRGGGEAVFELPAKHHIRQCHYNSGVDPPDHGQGCMWITLVLLAGKRFPIVIDAHSTPAHTHMVPTHTNTQTIHITTFRISGEASQEAKEVSELL